MDYMLSRWDAFSRFLSDGRICLPDVAVIKQHSDGHDRRILLPMEETLDPQRRPARAGHESRRQFLFRVEEVYRLHHPPHGHLSWKISADGCSFSTRKSDASDRASIPWRA